MQPLKYFAQQRGIEEFTYSHARLPTAIALESDQLAPLLVLAAAETYKLSGLASQERPFPWALMDDLEGATYSLMDIQVVEQASGLPHSIGYLFLDYELEALVMRCQQEPDFNPKVISLDSLAERMEIIAHEPDFKKRVPFELSL